MHSFCEKCVEGRVDHFPLMLRSSSEIFCEAQAHRTINQHFLTDVCLLMTALYSLISIFSYNLSVKGRLVDLVIFLAVSRETAIPERCHILKCPLAHFGSLISSTFLKKYILSCPQT